MPGDILFAVGIVIVFLVLFAGFFRPKTARPFLTGFLTVSLMLLVAYFLWRRMH